ncbi:MAG TPA: hypothetical protein VG295_06190, partial [Solirubrobacteraceae bacterium]|nr:hypothetical protein [Solirubrobacteraceae bacterium]
TAMRSDPTFVRGRLRLADGRRLTYSETGPRDGIPVLYCHGAIGTPLAGTVDLETITGELGVRYIAISRPGIGDLAVTVIQRHPELLTRVIAAHAAPGERRLLHRADERCAASTSFLDAASGGVRGMIEDYLVYSSPWGFTAAEVAAEVHLWHGLEDPLVPVEHALQLAVSLSRCRVFLDPDEGRRLAKILAVLVGRVEDPGEDAAALATARARGGRSAPARRRRP